MVEPFVNTDDPEECLRRAEICLNTALWFESMGKSHDASLALERGAAYERLAQELRGEKK